MHCVTVSWSDLIEIESQSNHHIAHVCTFVAHNQFVSSHDLLAIFIFASLKRARIKSKITGESHQILSLRLFLFFYMSSVRFMVLPLDCNSKASIKVHSSLYRHHNFLWMKGNLISQTLELTSLVHKAANVFAFIISTMIVPRSSLMYIISKTFILSW